MQSVSTSLRKTLSALTYLAAYEWSQLEFLQTKRRRLNAGLELSHGDATSPRAYIMESGWAYTYRLLKDGSRQVINFHLPGDFVALSHVILRYWEGGAVALTDIEVWEIAPNDISDIVQSRPRLATALLWAISREGALAEEHLVDLGRRTALVRTAHFLLELGTRLKHIGLATDAGYACPINQSLLADAVGISPIHLNRVLRQLRESGCLTFRNGYVSLDHPQRLIALAQYDGSYLEQPAQPLLL